MSRLAGTEGRLPGEGEGIGSGSGRGRKERRERVGTTPCHPRAGLSQIKYPRLGDEGGVGGEVCVYVAMPWSRATADACESCAGDMHMHRSYPCPCGYRDVRERSRNARHGWDIDARSYIVLNDDGAIFERALGRLSLPFEVRPPPTSTGLPLPSCGSVLDQKTRCALWTTERTDYLPTYLSG